MNDGEFRRRAHAYLSRPMSVGLDRAREEADAAEHIKLIRAGASDERSSVTEGLVSMLRARDAHGRAKYGTTLDRKDLSADQWAQHMLEELLDAAGYVQCLRREMRLDAFRSGENRSCP